MCGITGYINFDNNFDHNLIVNMLSKLIHRGPDDGAYYSDSFNGINVAIGHRRLSIIDLSKNGTQPIYFDDLIMSYNGEIYNFIEIRVELEALGYVFISNTDTEVVLKAIHKWGDKAIEKFNGMFSIALFNKNELSLKLFRDRVGVKPLYWYFDGAVFMFSSELKPFYQYAKFDKSIDIDSVAEFLKLGYIRQPKTIFRNCFKLESGTILKFDLTSKSIQINRYWEKITTPQTEAFDPKYFDIENELENLLKSSCEFRMISDVPVGLFLSGGYDSSLIAAILQKNKLDKIKTFTIGFESEKYNEAEYAKNIASFLGTEHFELFCTFEDVLEIIPKLPIIWDEPFADNSIIPTYLVSQFASKHVSVVLSADGGDELFGGYKKYNRAIQIYKFIFKTGIYKLKLDKITTIWPFNKLLANSQYSRFLSLISSRNLEVLLLNLQSFSSEIQIKNLLVPNYKKANLCNKGYSKNKKEGDIIEELLTIDLNTYLVDDILTKVDRSTMANSIEGREPLLDYRLIEFAAKISADLKIGKNENKIILKKIAHKYIPKNLLDRPKMGFTMPLENWLPKILQIYEQELFNYDFIVEQGIFNYKEINSLLNKYKKNQDLKVANRIWVLFVFQLWYKEWLN